MIDLIIRADDVGYSEAVNYGIEKTVKQGLIGSVGLMPNMPTAAHGLALLEGTGVCIGQHTNICIGRPCADPASIPSLLDENGMLKSSRTYREAWKKGECFTVLEEMVLEIEAQYQRFVELTGRQPDYFEGHAVLSKHLMQGLEIVAERHGLKYNNMYPGDETGIFGGRPVAACPMRSMDPDYDPARELKEAVLHARTDMPNVFVCHPGYLDAFLLRSSSLTVNRTKEVEMLCDPAMRTWLEEHDVRLLRYSDL